MISAAGLRGPPCAGRAKVPDRWPSLQSSSIMKALPAAAHWGARSRIAGPAKAARRSDRRCKRSIARRPSGQRNATAVLLEGAALADLAEPALEIRQLGPLWHQLH